MSVDRLLQGRLSSRGAVVIRLAAFAAATVTFLLVLVILAGAIAGHGSLAHASAAIASALAASVVLILAARRVDPLRRSLGGQSTR